MMAIDETRRYVVTPPPLQQTVPGIAQRVAGLSLLQSGVLYIIGFHAGEDGVFSMPANKLVLFVGAGSESQCGKIPRELERFGLVEEVKTSRFAWRSWRLTRLGREVFRELAGASDQ